MGRGDFFGKIFLIILIFVSGILYSSVRQDSIPGITLPDRDVFIQGTIVDVPESSGGKIRFTLDDMYIEGKKTQGKARLFVLRKKFFENEAQGYFTFGPGDRVSAVAKLRSPNVSRNPGIYSYDLKKDGIAAVGFIRQMKLIGRERGIFSWIQGKRLMLGKIIDNSLSAENASLHKAILPGLKRGINQDMRDAFSSTGIAHLLSISGTHFGLIAFMIFSIVRMTVKFLPVQILARMTLYVTPTQIAVVFTLPVLVLYALLSGASTPTIRSFIMVFIFMLALFLGRKGEWLNSLSIAALGILIWKPNALFELSFMLSFIAVLSIGYVLEKRAERENQKKEFELEYEIKTPEPSREGQSSAHKSPLPPFAKGGVRGIKMILDRVKITVLITIAAVLGTAPIVILYFKQFSLISPVTNLIVTPLVCFIILPLGFFSGCIALIFNMSSMPFSGLIEAITHFALSLIKGFSHIPYANLHVPNPSFLIIAFYFISLMFIVKSKVKWRFLPFIFVICIYLISPYLSDHNLRITFLDVGQGDTSLIELPDKKVMLIDGGSYVLDTGRRIIAPYLWSKGIRRVDYMVLSHPHPDHYGGLMYIMDNFRVGEIWLNGRRTPESEEFFQHIRKMKIPAKILRRGDVLETEGYTLYVFHPYDEFYAGSPSGESFNENSDSMVLKIESGDTSILFTGDIEKEAEENLIQLGAWLRSDIIKVPHHGGRTSSSERFLQVVSPQTAIVSVGKNNPFNHPHEETIERYNNAGIRFFRTDRDGAVIITSTGKSYGIKTFQDSRFRKVTGWRDEIRNLRLLL